MSPADQKRIVVELLENIRKDIFEAIDDCTIPEEWDGLELRELVFDKARESRGFSACRVHPSIKRVRDYRNLVLCNNI